MTCIHTFISFTEFRTPQPVTEQMLREDRESSGQRQHAKGLSMGVESAQDREDGRRDRQVAKEGSGGCQTEHVKSRLAHLTDGLCSFDNVQFSYKCRW